MLAETRPLNSKMGLGGYYLAKRGKSRWDKSYALDGPWLPIRCVS
jgi:hypothetical protein